MYSRGLQSKMKLTDFTLFNFHHFSDRCNSDFIYRYRILDMCAGIACGRYVSDCGRIYIELIKLNGYLDFAKGSKLKMIKNSLSVMVH